MNERTDSRPKHFERRLLIMKKSIRILAVVMALLMVTLVFASCGKTLKGAYKAEIGGSLAGYTATYTFSGKKVEISKTATLLGQSKTTTLEGTYEIAEKDDGTMEITISLETSDDDIKSGTFTFEEGENYIKIGLVKYEKVEK
jgi:major membrane immunogen (membrane-anchored lipoprotein)